MLAPLRSSGDAIIHSVGTEESIRGKTTDKKQAARARRL
jgi:hypothetical protein